MTLRRWRFGHDDARRGNRIAEKLPAHRCELLLAAGLGPAAFDLERRDDLPRRSSPLPPAFALRLARPERQAAVAGGETNDRRVTRLVRRRLALIHEPEPDPAAGAPYPHVGGPIVRAARFARLRHRLEDDELVGKILVRHPRGLVRAAGLETEPGDLVAAQVAHAVGADLGGRVRETGIDAHLDHVTLQEIVDIVDAGRPFLRWAARKTD